MVALFFALVLHVFTITAVGFVLPDPAPPPTTKTLGVVLLQTTTNTVVKDADNIAQAAHEGSGNTEEDKQHHPTTTSEAVFPDPQAQEVAEMPEFNAAKPQPTVDEINRLATEQIALQQVDTVLPRELEEPLADSTAGSDPLTLLSLTNTKRLKLMKEMNALQAEIDYETSNIRTPEIEITPQNPSPRAMYDVTAPYINDWIKQVKPLSDEDYLALLQEKPPFLLSGTVTVSIILNADGTLQKLQVLTSSGHDTLDKLALRSIRRGMPYSPFPPEITKQYEILSFRAEFEFKHNLTKSQ